MSEEKESDYQIINTKGDFTKLKKKENERWNTYAKRYHREKNIKCHTNEHRGNTWISAKRKVLEMETQQASNMSERIVTCLQKVDIN